MARCFAYVPPLNDEEEELRAGSSIKLQKERDNAKERKKEKKREKKDRKEKSKEHHGNSKHAEHNHNKRKYDERGQLTGEDEHCTKTIKDVIEQLEKSGLTEEFEPPSSVPNRPDSSDSTQDSHKRRKLVTPDACHTNNGLVLRIKLPFQKHDDVGGLSSIPQPSISRRGVQFLQPQKCRSPQPRQVCVPGLSATSDVGCFSGRVAEEPLSLQEHKSPEPSITDGQWPCSSSGIVPVAAGSQTQCREHKSRHSRSKEVQRQFRELIVDWKPCQLQFEDSKIGDQDWLSGTKDLCAARRCGASSPELPGRGSSTNPLQTRACYLPEFDMHTLPYVIPF